LVIEEVTREAMVRAVSELVHDGRVRLLLPKP
jgi:hypothetical protein